MKKVSLPANRALGYAIEEQLRSHRTADTDRPAKITLRHASDGRCLGAGSVLGGDRRVIAGVLADPTLLKISELHTITNDVV